MNKAAALQLLVGTSGLARMLWQWAENLVNRAAVTARKDHRFTKTARVWSEMIQPDRRERRE